MWFSSWLAALSALQFWHTLGALTYSLSASVGETPKAMRKRQAALVWARLEAAHPGTLTA